MLVQEEILSDSALIVTEGLRETLGVHTCDRRSKRSILQNKFPQAIFEPFPEDDELWQANFRETEEEITVRMSEWLRGLVAKHDGHVVLLATHSGAIRALYRAVGHPDVWPAQASLNPLLIKIT